MEWWEFFIVMIVVLPIMVLWLSCMIDAIMRPDISGWGKAAWMLFILFLPLIGSIVYIVTRPAIIVTEPGMGFGYRMPPQSSPGSQYSSGMPPPASNVEPRQT